MPGSDPPIIITGGSVTIEFDLSQLLPSGGKFSNQDKVIKRVEITGGGLPDYDATATGQNVVIRIHYGDP